MPRQAPTRPSEILFNVQTTTGVRFHRLKLLKLQALVYEGTVQREDLLQVHGNEQNEWLPAYMSQDLSFHASPATPAMPDIPQSSSGSVNLVMITGLIVMCIAVIAGCGVVGIMFLPFGGDEPIVDTTPEEVPSETPTGGLAAEDLSELEESRVRLEFELELKNAAGWLDAGEFESAQREALNAKVRLAGSETLFPATEFSQLTERVDSLLERIYNAKVLAALEAEVAELEDQPSPSENPVLTGAELFKKFSGSVPIVSAWCKPGECLLPGEYNHGTENGWHGHGSGILIEHDGRLIVVTNKHVIEDEKTMIHKLMFFSLNAAGVPTVSFELPAVVSTEFSVHPSNVDLAYLEVSDHRADFDRWDIAPAQLATGPPELGSDIKVIGHPGNSGEGILPLNITSGLVSNYQEHSDGELNGWMIGSDATFNPGNSGGPGFSDSGAILGIATFVSNHGLTGGSQNYLVAATEVDHMLDQGVPYRLEDGVETARARALGALQSTDAIRECDRLAGWPLSLTEMQFLIQVEAAQEDGGLGWTPVHCQVISGLKDGQEISYNISDWFDREISKDVREFFILAIASTAADIDIFMMTADDKIISSDINPRRFASLRGQRKGTATPARKFSVKNAGGGKTDVLILIYY